jgi:hypothetical protein
LISNVGEDMKKSLTIALAAVMLTAAPGSRDAARLGEVLGGTADGRAVIKVGQPGPG